MPNTTTQSGSRLAKGNAGFGLVNMIIAAGIMAVATAAVLTAVMQHQNTLAENNFKSNVFEIRQAVVAALSSDSSWMVTQNRNSGMKCMSASQQYCAAGGTQRKEFDLYDANGELIYRTTSPTAGFRFDGTKCDTFSPAGNDNCPLRAVLEWRGSCTNGACTTYENFLSIHFVFAPSSKNKKFPFNAANYNVVEQTRRKLGGNDTPIMICARKGMLYIGESNSFNGQPADAEGCISYQAFRGPTGPQGPVGARGIAGSTGPMGFTGPAGADAVCP
jgi:type II secretory pathway pseudopilin PulG